jgi:hypothetical protein
MQESYRALPLNITILKSQYRRILAVSGRLSFSCTNNFANRNFACGVHIIQEVRQMYKTIFLRGDCTALQTTYFIFVLY